MEPKLEETSSVQESTGQGERSLKEEMQEIERGAGVQECGTESPGRSGGAGRREDDYVAQEEVEGYLARMKEEGENYVDENQVACTCLYFSLNPATSLVPCQRCLKTVYFR